MKTNNFSSISVKSTSNGVQLSFNIPFKEYSLQAIRESRKPEKIIEQFASHIINALKERGDACISNLMNHINDVIACAEFTIVYKRKDGTIHQFNLPSYKDMKDAIKVLKDSDWTGFLNNPRFVDQSIKALYWVDRPQDESGKFKFSDLISLLTEVHMFGPMNQSHINSL